MGATYKLKRKKADGTLEDVALAGGLSFVNNITAIAGSTNNPTKWYVANVGGVTTPTDGMTIAVRTPNGGHSYGIALSINGGNNYYPVIRNKDTQISTQYPQGVTLILTFNSTQEVYSYLTGAYAKITGCWQIADYSDDRYVSQTYTTTNDVYPLLFRSKAGRTSTSNILSQTRYANNIYVNPATGTVYATTFNGALKGNADSANIATQALTATTAMDSQKLGGVLASQYALKSNLDDYATLQALDATDRDVSAIVQGTTTVGNASKLGGVAADQYALKSDIPSDGGGSSLYGDWELPSQSVAQGDDTTLYFDVPINAKTIEVCFDSDQNFTFDLVLWNGNTISIDTAEIDANNIPHSCSVIIDVVSGSVMLYGCDNGGDPAVIYEGNIHPSSHYRYSIYGYLAIETSGMYSSDVSFWVKGTSYLSYASENW